MRWGFRRLFSEGGWRADSVVEVDGAGRVVRVDQGNADRWFEGVAVPALPNLHSHAFQRAMAGLGERVEPRDSFWSWRTRMYELARGLSPDTLRRVATELYREMSDAGYGPVLEFHYVHHRVDGTAYAEPAELSLALYEAAEAAGIDLVLAPVLYQTAGFDRAPPSDTQRRFFHRTEDYLRLLERLSDRPLAVAFHSLRAVPFEAIDDVLGFRADRLAGCPVHVHIAEQPLEVQACLERFGRRPVELLLDRVEVDRTWCLVHATHTTPSELRALARTGAVVGLCPSTEANLADGLFDLPTWIEAGGAYGVGSDSHVTVDPLEELRWLEYGQRLRTGRRGVATGTTGGSVAEALWLATAEGGARALGEEGPLRPGAPARLLVFEAPDDAEDAPLDVLVFRSRLRRIPFERPTA